jgi:hypothetical protein
MQKHACQIQLHRTRWNGAALVLWSLIGCAQVEIQPPQAGSGVPASEQIFGYEPPSEFAVEFLGAFVRDTPKVIRDMPYSGVGITENVIVLKPLSDKPIYKSRRVRYVRDGRGRTRAEVLTPEGEAQPDGATRIDDPVRGERYRFRSADNSLYVLPFNLSGAEVRGPVPAPPPFAGTVTQILAEFGGDDVRGTGPAVCKTAPLKTRSIAGVGTDGSRIECTIPGKRNPIKLISEQRFSPDLGVVMTASVELFVTPELNVKTQYRLELVRGEPDPGLFEIPDGLERREIPP